MSSSKSGGKTPSANPHEVLRDNSRGSSYAKDILAERKRMEEEISRVQKQEKRRPANAEYTTIFDRTTHIETYDKQDRIKELQTVISEIQVEIAAIKTQGSEISAEVAEIEKAAMESIPDKVGVYHVRYFEHILRFLKNIRTKVGEARTWLMAMQSKKAKRGSAFVQRSKKKGTQYSLSQELQTARNVT